MKAALLFLLAASMLGLGIWTLLKSQRKQAADRVEERLADAFQMLPGAAAPSTPTQSVSTGNRLILWYWRAGIELTQAKLVLFWRWRRSRSWSRRRPGAVSVRSALRRRQPRSRWCCRTGNLPSAAKKWSRRFPC
jgi:hypothetical protein